MKRALILNFFILLLVSAATAQEIMPISAVQGDGYYSPLAKKEVTVQGIVTGIRQGGFFIQSPDDKTDNDQKTSEGLYIFTLEPPSSKIAVGNLVEVKGKVGEFRSERNKYSLFRTEIANPKINVVSTGNPLPTAITLTHDDLKPSGQIDQLERFEGMRVKIDELTVVAPTGGYYNAKLDKTVSDGVFFSVIKGTPRPFREAGIETLKYLIDKISDPLVVFDMNPELIRVESYGLNGGEKIDATAGAALKNVEGIIDYAKGSYTLLIDPRQRPVVENNRTFIKASPAAEDEITVASFNLENFFDDEENSDLGDNKETILTSEHFRKRLKKASLAIREVVSMPDVLGIIEVENLPALQKLAKRINEDAAAAGLADPKYEAVLEESNDLRGIDVGFLIKTSKVKVIGKEHLAKDIKLDHKDANPNETLFSRPPYLIEVETLNGETENPFKFTVIVNHFKSYRGIDDAKDGDRVRNKRRMQAEFLAKYVSEREQANPGEIIILVGDFNAFQFNDGYNDLIGTLKGKPSTNVIAPSETSYETGLIDLVDYINLENRYSYIYGGSAQVLDHILTNKPARKRAAKFGYARLNADFPKVYADDETRPERVSDHDVPVFYLSVPKKETPE